MNPLLYVKPYVSYPENIKKEIHLISFYPKGLATPFGSFIYRFQKYAGDIDLLENVSYNTELSTIQTFIRVLKKIIRSLDKYHLFSEFKAGLDHNYEIDIGTLDNGIYNINKNFIDVLIEKYNQGLFHNYEITSIHKSLELLGKGYDSMIYDYIYNLIREKRILRWNSKEIMNSYKIISNKQKYSLAQALRDNSIVKIDLIVLINGKFIEVTNIVSLTYPVLDSNGNTFYEPINIAEEFTLGLNGLQTDIEKLYYSNKFYSPFKACKRVYSVIRQIKDYSYLNIIRKIIRGDISLLYQLKSEIDSLIIILERIKKPPIKEINNCLQDIKGRLNYVLYISQKEIIFFSEEIDSITNNKNKNEKLELIKDLNKKIKYIIELITVKKMNDVNFNPFPLLFLPNKYKYDRSIIRKPSEYPTKEYSKFLKLVEM